MQSVKPDSIQTSKLIYKLENGEIKVPQFQRDFVWSPEQSAKLIDSILKGYPIGAFTFWKTSDRLRSIRNIGGLELPDSPNDHINYVLDGQQRITSIYACLKGVTIGDSDYSTICVDLKADEDDQIVLVNIPDPESSRYISLIDLWKNDPRMMVEKYYNGAPEYIWERTQQLNHLLSGYQFSIIELEDATLSVATDIFTRINTTGNSLSVFEIMCAKTYDEGLEFDLYEKRKEQLEAWESVNYETVPNQTVLQAISMCIQNRCKRKDILQMEKKTFIQAWEPVNEAFSHAIDYMRSYYSIQVSKLLPYDAILVPFVYYFYKNNNKKPSGQNAVYLRDYFWRCVLTQKFSEGVEAKLAADCSNVIDNILNNKEPKEEGLPVVDISYNYIKKNGVFKISSAFIKGLLCLYASQRPESFNDGTTVVIDNSWLTQANSKNYHHFFPKNYMKKKQPLVEEDLVNHIVNITIVDAYLNKAVIKDRAPSDYLRDFQESYEGLNETMKTHLIDLDEFKVWDNNYETFFDKRIERIQDQLKKQLRLTEYDKVDPKYTKENT